MRKTTTFGTLGIVEGQTARLSAVRSGEEDDGAALCRVGLKFFDTAGNQQATSTADLERGQAAFLDLNRSDIQQGGSRAQIYAVVDVTSDATKSGDPRCGVAMSIELVDQADGRTRIYQGAFVTQVEEKPPDPGCCCKCCKRDPKTGVCLIRSCTCVAPGQVCEVICPR